MKTKHPLTKDWADLFIAAVVWLAAGGVALADGGVVRARQTVGSYTITVFSAPTPLRVGFADVSVFVQDAESGAAVLDAVVAVSLEAAGQPPRVLRNAATHAAAVNKLLYVAEFDLPVAGRWRGAVAIHAGDGESTVPFEVDAAPPLLHAVAFWPYLAAPFVAVALYTLHQWLARRSAREAGGYRW